MSSPSELGPGFGWSSVKSAYSLISDSNQDGYGSYGDTYENDDNYENGSEYDDDDVDNAITPEDTWEVISAYFDCMVTSVNSSNESIC